MPHNRDVPWSDEQVEMPEDLLQKWECRTEWLDDLHWVQIAEGPCPGCDADISGYTSNEPGPIYRQLLEAEGEPGKGLQVKVPVDCNCGFDHKQKDAGGCGRSCIPICAVSAPPRKDNHQEVAEDGA